MGSSVAYQTALDAFLLAFPALFSIVNPLGGAIIFHELTSQRGHAARMMLARRVGAYSIAVMLASLLAGSTILSFFGISLNALRIAGGIVIATQAFEMLFKPEARTAQKVQETAQVDRGADDLAAYAFFPLTLPFTTGPGTIAVAVTLGTERPDGIAFRTAFYSGAGLAAVALAIIIWVSYSAADRLADALGETGRQVVSRIVAFLLLGIGVQICLGGIVPVLHGALRQ